MGMRRTTSKQLECGSLNAAIEDETGRVLNEWGMFHVRPSQ
jgi:hypothetical protein